MVTGARFRTEAGGYLQISDQVPNFVFVAKGSVNLADTPVDLGSNVYPGSHAEISIPNRLGYPPIVAFTSATPIAVLRARLVGGNWVFVVSAQNVGTSGTVYWWCFEPFSGDVNSLSKHGFKVMSADGTKLHYHSDLKPMVVLDVRTQAAGSSTAVSVPAGRKLAIAIMSTLWTVTAQIPAGAWVQYLTSTGLRTTSDTDGNIIPSQQFGEFRWGLNFGFGAGSSGSWGAMVIDVTGY